MIEIGAQLAAAIEARLGAWVAACVEARFKEAFGELTDLARARAEDAGRRALQALGPAFGQLLTADVDEQAMTPISLLRQAVQYPTEALASLEVPPVERDRFARERFPHDLYALIPANLDVLGNDVGELAIAWGAAKAYAHRERHRGAR